MPRFFALAACALFVFTMSREFHSVPPVHFDEAWFGNLALQLLADPAAGVSGLAGLAGQPGMNSYTRPVMSYLAALGFHVLGPAPESARVTVWVLNLLTFVLLLGGVKRFTNGSARGWLAAGFTGVILALLPVSVFTHRIQLEVTNWFAFCYALVLWGLGLWRSRPRLSMCLLAAGMILGLYSHVLFFTVAFSVYWLVLWNHSEELFSPRGRHFALALNALLALSPLRMGLALRDPFPFLVAGAFVVMAILPWFAASGHAGAASSGRTGVLKRFFDQRPRWIGITVAVGTALPLALYFAILVNGIWPYAQITGDLRLFLVPANLGIFALLLAHGLAGRRHHWEFFALQVFLTAFAILKPTNAKYWMIPTLTLALIAGTAWADLLLRGNRKLALAMLAVFLGWNLHLFESAFLDRYLRHGTTNEPFRAWIFHDNPRYYRPIVAIYRWLEVRGCQRNPLQTDDGRITSVAEYYQATEKARARLQHLPPPACALGAGAFLAAKKDAAPQGFREVASDPAWGDLVLFQAETAKISF